MLKDKIIDIHMHIGGEGTGASRFGIRSMSDTAKVYRTVLFLLFFISALGCDSGTWKSINSKFDVQGRIVSIKGLAFNWAVADARETGYSDEIIFTPEKISPKCRGNAGASGYGFTMTVETNMAGLELEDLIGNNLRTASDKNCFREISLCEDNAGCPSHSVLKSQIKRDDFGNPYFERTCWIDFGRPGSAVYVPGQGERFSLTMRAIGKDADDVRKINIYAVRERPQITSLKVDRDRIPRQGGLIRLNAGIRYATGITLRDQDGKIIKEEDSDIWSVDTRTVELEFHVNRTTLLTLVARNPAGANQQNILIRAE